MDKPFAVFAVIEIYPNHYAATTRASDRGESGKLGLPGGKVDPGEDPVVAVKREAEEEGWLIDGINPTPIKKELFDGKMIWWYKAKTAQKLNDFKEKGRIEPIVANGDELASFGYGNEFLGSKETLNENTKRKILKLFLEEVNSDLSSP